MQKCVDVVVDRKGNVVEGASVLVKTLDGITAELFSENGPFPLANPLTTDSLGGFDFYAVNGRYILEISVDGLLQSTRRDVLLEDPMDSTPEVIDGGTISNVDLENVTIDGSPPVTQEQVGDVIAATEAANEAADAANAAAIEANQLRADLASTTDPDKGAALMQWLLEYTGTVALRQELKNTERVSVASFGVTGIGDDTVAMQKAIAWQLAKRSTWNPSIGGGGGSALVNCPVLTIPNGWHVLVQGDLQPPCFLVAEGRASIESLDNTKDIFAGSDSYKSYFGYLNFVHGKTQIRLQNANINSGTWTCDTCTFEGANDYAVQFLNTSGSYPVTSTQPILINCNFIRCKRGVKSQADHTFHLGGWMQPEGDFFDANTGFIWTNGLYTINWVMTIPGGTFPARARWFDCWGAVRGQGTRFGGEGGGLPIVYWFATPNRYTLGSPENIDMGVSFDQCLLYGGNAARTDRGIVNTRGQLPPIIRVTNSLGGITCPYITNESGANGGIPDITAYLVALKATWNNDDLYNELSYHFTGTKKKTNGNVLWPAELDTFVYTDKPYIPRKAKVKTAGTPTVATGTTAPISLDGTDYDGYGLRFQESGTTWGIKAPYGAKFANVVAYVELASHTSNNLVYTAKIYRNNALIADLQNDVIHSTTAARRLTVQGRVACAAGESFTLRYFQNSGTAQTVTLASMEITFD